MKKFISITLVMLMAFSMCSTAFALDTIESVTANNTSTGSVDVTLTEGVNDLTVYSVTVAWDDTSMEYQTEGEGTWNPSTHQYDGETIDGWVDNKAEVTVTNHSNAGVTATIAEGDKETTGVEYGFTVNSVDADSFDLETAVGTEPENAPANTFVITATSDSVPTAGIDKFTVTITGETPVSPAQPIELDIYKTPLTYDIEKGVEYEFNASIMSLSASEDEEQANPLDSNMYSWSNMTGIFTVSESYTGDVVYLELMDDGMDSYLMTLNIN